MVNENYLTQKFVIDARKDFGLKWPATNLNYGKTVLFKSIVF